MISIKVQVKINRDISQKIIQQIDQGMDDLADAIFARSQELCPVDEATLKKSGHVEREFLDKIIAYDAPHAGALEFGAVPHMSPIEPLILWSRRVLGLSDKEAKKAGWAIAMAIKQRGGIPQPFLRPALSEMQAHAAEIIEKRMKRMTSP